MKVKVIFYSMYGHVRRLAEAVAEGAREVEGAEVELLQVPELVPEEVLEESGAKAARAAFAHVPVARPEDLEGADAILFGTPTRFGNMAAQMRSFLDQTGPLWMKGALANKTFTATTSAQNAHGGQEATILSLYTTAMHWGAILVPPGYTDQSVFDAGGNPYGFSAKAGEVDDKGRAAVAHQARRLVEMTSKIAA